VSEIFKSASLDFDGSWVDLATHGKSI